MRTIKFLIPAFLLVSSVVKGQTPATGTEYDFRSRTSVGMDWKIVKGLHLEADYELRTADRFSRIERHQLGAGIRYSPINHLDIGAGYCFIGHFDSGKTFKPRHRLYFDLTGGCKFGAWKLSLLERIQMTNKSYDFNRFQQTPNLLELKSRLKLAYKGFIHLEPYAFIELRNCFNGPSFTAEYNEKTGKYKNYLFTGYSDTYINRLRGSLGLEWKVNSHHEIDFKMMADWCRDKSIDTNAEGTKLKACSWEQALNTTISVGYTVRW